MKDAMICVAIAAVGMIGHFMFGAVTPSMIFG